MKNYKYIVIAVFLLFIVGNVYNYIFNSDSFSNYLKKEYFPKSVEGKIYDIMPIKGGSLFIKIHSKSQHCLFRQHQETVS
ncbi:hypothetical protein OZN48_07210 [Chryseobacterium indologenes]|uniref:hypothetical protein n=1 Tax=Chryseobacterium indologenes TaxID=253 RepID=UPI002D7E6DC6|nr:hypothetical protein [Chryseobacterium indologenes]MEB4760272.1 hypothetical protein [Chryseobacterium indologenes]